MRRWIPDARCCGFTFCEARGGRFGRRRSDWRRGWRRRREGACFDAETRRRGGRRGDNTRNGSIRRGGSVIRVEVTAPDPALRAGLEELMSSSPGLRLAGDDADVLLAAVPL